MAGHIPDSLSVDWCTPDKVIVPLHEFFGGAPALDPCSNPHSHVGAAQEWTLEKGNDGLVQPWNAPTIFCNPPFGKGWWRPLPHQPQCNKIVVDGGAGPPYCACGAERRREYMWPAERKALMESVKAGTLTKAQLKALLDEYTTVSIADWIKLCADAGTAPAVTREVVGLIPAYPGTKAFQDHVWKRARAVFFPRGRLHFRLVYQTTEGPYEISGPAPMDCCMPYWGHHYVNKFKAVFEPLGKVVIL